MTDKDPAPRAVAVDVRDHDGEVATEARQYSVISPVQRPAQIDRPQREYPQYAIALSVLDFLMAEGSRAIFKRRHDAENRSVEESPYRATVFWPVRVGDHDRLYPFVRARLGGVPVPSEAPIYFLKDEAEAFAGAAWAILGTPIRSTVLPPRTVLGDTAWRAAWHELGVPLRVSQQMGHNPHSYIRKVRSIACIGAQTIYGPIVVVVESTRASGFDGKYLTDYALQKFGKVGVALKQIPEQVGGHADFWTWSLRLGRGWRAPVAAVVALLGVVGPLIRDFWGTLGKREPLVALYTPWVLPVCFVLLAFGFVPNMRPTDTAAAVSPRVEAFLRRWKRVWLLLTIAHVVIGMLTLQHGLLAEWLVPRARAQGLLQGAAALSVLGAAYYTFSCYLCLVHATDSSEREYPMEGGPPSNTPIVALLIVVFFGSLIFGNSLTMALLCGVVFSVAACLLAGRLDSRLMGTPGVLVAALYLYAVTFPISYCAWCHKEGNVIARLAGAGGHADAIAGAMSVCSVPLVAGLFAVVAWLIHGRTLERYLLNIERVALLVPRRSLRSVWQEVQRRTKNSE